MHTAPDVIPLRTVGEWALTTSRAWREPFTDLVVTAIFTGPSGETATIEGFHDGDATWRVRFNPREPGRWCYRIASWPADPDLRAEGTFEVADRPVRGFLRSTPGEAWGFRYENGEPVFLFGDTVYNLFGMAHCGADVRPFLQRRAAQGFNLLRIRLPVSPFTRRTGTTPGRPVAHGRGAAASSRRASTASTSPTSAPSTASSASPRSSASASS